MWRRLGFLFSHVISHQPGFLPPPTLALILTAIYSLTHTAWTCHVIPLSVSPGQQISEIQNANKNVFNRLVTVFLALILTRSSSAHELQLWDSQPMSGETPIPPPEVKTLPQKVGLCSVPQTNKVLRVAGWLPSWATLSVPWKQDGAAPKMVLLR